MMLQPNKNIMFISPTKWQRWDQVERFWKEQVKFSWALKWLMLELRNGSVQHNNLFINNIMLHWDLDKNLKIGVCDWECTSHMGEDVKSLWHTDTKEPKKKIQSRGSGGWRPSCLGSRVGDIKIRPNNTARRLRVLWSATCMVTLQSRSWLNSLCQGGYVFGLRSQPHHLHTLLSKVHIILSWHMYNVDWPNFKIKLDEFPPCTKEMGLSLSFFSHPLLLLASLSLSRDHSCVFHSWVLVECLQSFTTTLFQSARVRCWGVWPSLSSIGSKCLDPCDIVSQNVVEGWKLELFFWYLSNLIF